MFTMGPPLWGGGAAVDPHFANVVLLMHADGANGSTTFVDSSPVGRAMTAVSGATISTAQAKFGGSSANSTGGADNITIAANADILYKNTFTCEFWIYVAALPAAQAYFMVDITIHSNYFSLVSTGQISLTSASTMSVGFLTAANWAHVAVCQNGATAYAFLNGSLISSGSAQWVDSGSGDKGIFQAASLGNPLVGFIDELRFTKGVCRYTASFTPPSAPFPNA